MFQLAIPPLVASYLGDLYSRSSVVLEYGTGGSSFLALEANKLTILFACETDFQWLERLSIEISARGYEDRFYPVYQDVGATKELGYPCFDKEGFSDKRYAKIISAPFLPWRMMERLDFSPDTILVDGRYRVASFLASCAHIKKPMTLVFDDYIDRPAYHVVEELVKPIEFVDRAAVFHLKPGIVDVGTWILARPELLVNPF